MGAALWVLMVLAKGVPTPSTRRSIASRDLHLVPGALAGKVHDAAMNRVLGAVDVFLRVHQAADE